MIPWLASRSLAARLTKKSAYAPEYGDSGGQPSLSLRYERRLVAGVGVEPTTNGL